MSRYFGGLSGERLAIFTECMRQEGKFCCHHLKVRGKPVDNKALLNFQNRMLLEAVGTDPKVYVVPETMAKKFTEKYPDIRVQYIKNKVPSSRKHCSPKNSVQLRKSKL